MKTLFEVIPNAVHTAAPLAATPLTEIQNCVSVRQPLQSATPPH
jgi:hypothetical protein